MATQTVPHISWQSELALVIPIQAPAVNPITQDELETVLLLRNARNADAWRIE